MNQDKIMIRNIFALPVLIIGASFLKLGEIISGKKYFYGADLVTDIMKSKMKCSNCGHTATNLTVQRQTPDTTFGS